MTLPSIPPPHTPVEGPEPGLSIAEATVVTESMYSKPYRLTSWATDGAWFKYTASSKYTVLIDNLLSLKSTQVTSRGDSYCQLRIYTGPAGASTLGELQLVDQLLSPSSTELYPTAGQTYFFQFIVSDSDEERPQFGRPVPWYVVLRISSPGKWTDWIDPPATTIAFYRPPPDDFGGGSSTWFTATDDRSHADNPDTDVLRYAAPPATWNTGSQAYSDASNFVIEGGYDLWGGHTCHMFFLDLAGHPGADDPGLAPEAYYASWQAALGGIRGTQNFWHYRNGEDTSNAPFPDYSSHVYASSQGSTFGDGGHGFVGWRVLRGHASPFLDNYTGYSEIQAQVLATSVKCSLIAALHLMGPIGTVNVQALEGELAAAGYSVDYWADGGKYGYLFEQPLPTLVAVDARPDEPPSWKGVGSIQFTAQVPIETRPCTVEWRVSTTVGGTNCWGPTNGYWMMPPAADNYPWTGGGAGPEEYEARSSSLCLYDGGRAGWTTVPAEIWQAALANEKVRYENLKAAGYPNPWDQAYGLEFVGMPFEALNANYPIPVIPPFGEVDGARAYQTMAIRLHVKPSRFKVALAPKLEDATPVYPEDIPPTGATGPGRRTFGRPSET